MEKVWSSKWRAWEKTSGGSGSEASKWRRFGHAQSGGPGSEASKWRRFGHKVEGLGVRLASGEGLVTLKLVEGLGVRLASDEN